MRKIHVGDADNQKNRDSTKPKLKRKKKKNRERKIVRSQSKNKQMIITEYINFQGQLERMEIKE